jgi:hypothetical protein
VKLRRNEWSSGARQAGIANLAPHDLRRTCARLCHDCCGELEQIRFLLGHASIQTTERYIGSKQKLQDAVNDRFAISGRKRDRRRSQSAHLETVGRDPTHRALLPRRGNPCVVVRLARTTDCHDGVRGRTSKRADPVLSRHNKIKMVQRNRIISVQRNNINTAQHNRRMEARSLKETGHGQTP